MKNNNFNPDDYNRDKIKKGDNVIVKISPYEYFATVDSIKIDTKNRKVFARLSNTKNGLPVIVDIQDCTKTSLLDPANYQ